MCRENDDTFSAIEILCAHLTPFGVAVRYPDEIAPNESMVAADRINVIALITGCCNGKSKMYYLNDSIGFSVFR
jgi:hypothetical protein